MAFGSNKLTKSPVPPINAPCIDAKATLVSIVTSFLGLISFCLAASIVYIINDIQDKEKDKLHEKKKNRPIASGRIKVKNAIIFAVFLLIISYGITMFIEQKIICESYIFILFYIIINILYSIKLKNITLELYMVHF